MYAIVGAVAEDALGGIAQIAPTTRFSAALGQRRYVQIHPAHYALDRDRPGENGLVKDRLARGTLVATL